MICFHFARCMVLLDYTLCHWGRYFILDKALKMWAVITFLGENERAVRKGNSSVTVCDLCSGVYSICRRVCLCVCVCVGGLKVTLNGIAAFVYVCVSMQIPLERVRWRLSSASSSICREGHKQAVEHNREHRKNGLSFGYTFFQLQSTLFFLLVKHKFHT